MHPICWIIIVNYRTADLTLNCLQSISTQVGALGGGRAVVVDNDSGDGSVERIASFINECGWSAWAQVMASGRNGGFAYGSNLGIGAALAGAAHPDYVLLLNPDTRMNEGAIHAILAFMEDHPGAGIAGSLLENPNGVTECSAHRFHSPLSELDSGARLGVLSRLLHRHVVSEMPRQLAHQCDWVSGASMLIRRQVIEEIGLLDEGFFLYFEEVDYCKRANCAGWECWYVPESRVMHVEGASTGIMQTARRRPAYWYDSRRRYFAKHYGVAGLLLADFLWMVGRLSYLLRRLLRLGAQGAHRDPARFMLDLLYGDLRALLTGRLFGLAMTKK